MHAYYLDNLPTDQRLPHITDPAGLVSAETLAKLGVLSWIVGLSPSTGTRAVDAHGRADPHRRRIRRPTGPLPPLHPRYEGLDKGVEVVQGATCILLFYIPLFSVICYIAFFVCPRDAFAVVVSRRVRFVDFEGGFSRSGAGTLRHCDARSSALPSIPFDAAFRKVAGIIPSSRLRPPFASRLFEADPSRTRRLTSLPLPPWPHRFSAPSSRLPPLLRRPSSASVEAASHFLPHLSSVALRYLFPASLPFPLQTPVPSLLSLLLFPPPSPLFPPFYAR
ncbi:1,2-dihydroxy-3-keto-5-methylthiopentene dioxygenase [Mycena sanguinolenta]|uniref:1,2-dihydroxy-3-keto-5-methylthiopentene dioxygenase n=1 Tax=Mycena sanguinolenta TaxID=230812 RepID=A0A8H6Y898_9AGAR|nr:1,2-dihydroxy-3-keto-5-methylthiopentene dioxygenase [Mycena sanguinolenta]